MKAKRVLISAMSYVLAMGANLSAAADPTNWRSEDQETNDGEHAKVLYFETKAGVNYILQHSADLHSWSNVQDFYGLGHEISVTLFTHEQVTNPPPPPGDPVPDPQVRAFLRMIQPTSGGLLLSWPSLDHGEAVNWLLPTNPLVPEWSSIILHSTTYQDHNFFVLNAQSSDAPLPEIDPLGPLDAAMIPVFSNAISQMNAEVVNQVSSTDPAEIPSAPGSRGWYRLVADWGFSADGDDRPDWIEFEAGDTDPFSGDSDGDGVLDDGDLDGDGILDSEDAIVNDPLINWKATKGRPYFILVPVEGLVSNSEGAPIAINNEGAVAFKNEIWHFDDSLEIEPIPTPYPFEFPQLDGSIETEFLAYDGANGVEFLTDTGKIIGMANEDPSDFSGTPRFRLFGHLALRLRSLWEAAFRCGRLIKCL